MTRSALIELQCHVGDQLPTGQILRSVSVVCRSRSGLCHEVPAEAFLAISLGALVIEQVGAEFISSDGIASFSPGHKALRSFKLASSLPRRRWNKANSAYALLYR